MCSKDKVQKMSCHEQTQAARAPHPSFTFLHHDITDQPPVQTKVEASQATWALQQGASPAGASTTFDVPCHTSSDYLPKLECENSYLRQQLTAVANWLGLATVEANDVSKALAAKLRRMQLEINLGRKRSEKFQLKELVTADRCSIENEQLGYHLAGSQWTVTTLQEERDAAFARLRDQPQQRNKYVKGAAIPDVNAMVALYDMYSHPTFKDVEIRVKGAIIPKGFTVSFVPCPTLIGPNTMVQQLRAMSTLSNDVVLLRPCEWRLSIIDITASISASAHSLVTKDTQPFADIDEKLPLTRREKKVRFEEPSSVEMSTAPWERSRAWKANSQTAPKMEINANEYASQTTEVWVGNLEHGTTNQQLASLFAGYSFVSVEVIKDRSRHGCVTFASGSVAQQAVHDLKGTIFLSRHISFSFARPCHLATGGGVWIARNANLACGMKRKRE